LKGAVSPLTRAAVVGTGSEEQAPLPIPNQQTTDYTKLGIPDWREMLQ